MDPSIEATASEHRSRMLWLLAIVVAGVALRFFRLDHQSLWLDETSQISTAEDVGRLGLGSVVLTDNVAPLSHWILWGVLKTFGVSAVSARLPSVIESALTIPLVYLLGTKLFRPAIGLVAAAMMALSPFAVWHGQDARMYALVMALATGIMLAFWRCISPDSRKWDWAALVAVTALAVYAHQFSVLLVAACGIYLFWQEGLRGKNLLPWLFCQALAGALFVPWFLHSLGRLGEPAGTIKSAPILWLPYTSFAFLFGYSLGPSVADLHWGLAAVIAHWQLFGAAALPAICLIVVSARQTLAAPHDHAASPGRFVVLSAAVPIALALLAPLVSHISYNVRYVSVAFPAFIVLLAQGADAAWRAPRRATAMLSACVAPFWFFSLYNWYADPQYAKADMRDAATFLRNAFRREDSLVVVSGSARTPLGFYGFPTPAEAGAVFATNLDQIAGSLERPFRPGEGHTWLVESRPWEADPQGRIRAVLDRAARLRESHEWPGVVIREYEARTEYASPR